MFGFVHSIPGAAERGGSRPSLILAPGRLAEQAGFVRLGSAERYGPGGALETVAANLPRLDHDPASGAPRGVLFEGQRSNAIRNSAMVGAAAGTPGTAPTHSSLSVGANGLSRSIGLAMVNGVAFLDVAIAGTATADGYLLINADAAGATGAAFGQTWTGSAFYQLVAGADPGAARLIEVISEHGSSGAYLTGSARGLAPQAVLARKSFTRTLTQADVASCRYYVQLAYLAGQSYGFTLRFGLPQLEQGAYATTPILTSGAQVTRLAESASRALGGEFNASGQSFAGVVMPMSAAGGFRRVVGWDAGNSSNRIALHLSTSGRLQLVSSVAGATTGDVLGPPIGTTATRFCMGFDRASGLLRLAVNGMTYEGTASALPAGLSMRRIGSDEAGGSQPDAWLDGLARFGGFAEFPRLLSTAEMQGMTA